MEPADRKRLVDRGYHFTPQTTGNVTDVGLLKSTILPSFALNSTLSLTSYLLSRSTQTGEIKDWFWPTAQVANAWWSALGSRMYHDGISLSRAWSSLSWTEKLLLSLVSIWGTRLFYRISKRTITRGKDDPRYEELKAKDPEGFWSSALYKHFLPEAVFLTFISLPFTVPFRLGGSAVKVGSEEVRGWLRALGVGLFGAGFAMEVIADKQLDVHRKEGRKGLCRTGVWSIVRHPK